MVVALCLGAQVGPKLPRAVMLCASSYLVGSLHSSSNGKLGSLQLATRNLLIWKG